MNIKEVAEKANVSITTVSRVMNNPDSVSEKTKDRVLKVMKELNYIPNWFARNLQNKRTNVIGLLIPDIMDQSNMELAKGVEKVARQKAYSMILCNTEYDVEIEKDHIDTLINRKIDGLILTASAFTGTDIKALSKREVPFVLIDRVDCTGYENVVYTNYCEASEEAVRHFIDMGRKRIAMILPKQPAIINGFKLEGYRNALSRHGMSCDNALVIETDNSIEGGMVAMEKLLDGSDRPDAVFAATDTIAFGVLETVRQMGLSANHIGVVGYDDLKTGSVMEPKLTTITRPSYRMGLTAARVLFDMIEDENDGGELQSIMLQSRLKIRKSCGNKERIKEIW